MKLHPLVFAAVLLLAVAAGFGVGVFVQSRHPLLAVNAPALPDVNPNGNPLLKPDDPGIAKTKAKRDALLDYLDGKELRDEKKQPHLGATGKPLAFRKADIAAVQFADVASKSGNEPWSTSVTLVATADGKRYAIHARLQYREVESTYAIVSFEPTEVSPQ